MKLTCILVALCAATLAVPLTATALEAPPVFMLKWGSSGTGIGQFSTPSDLAVDANGHIYVADTGNSRIQIFDGNGNWLGSFGSSGSQPGQLLNPKGIMIAPNGNIYVSEKGNDRIQAFAPNGTYLFGWGREGVGNGRFQDPAGLAMDDDGFVYVADFSNELIQKFTTTGTFVLQWHIDRAGGEPPVDIAVGPDGYLYITDGNIEKYTRDGQYITDWEGGVGEGLEYLTFDGDGNIYATGSTSQVFKFSTSGTLLTKWGSFGTDDGKFQYPSGVAVDRTGSIFVAQTEEVARALMHDKIQKFGPGATPTLPASWGRIKSLYR
jgi:tripartite motif-containing protein 71